MDIKKSIERATIDKRELQKKTAQMKSSWDEVQRIIGSGRKKGKKK